MGSSLHIRDAKEIRIAAPERVDLGGGFAPVDKFELHVLQTDGSVFELMVMGRLGSLMPRPLRPEAHKVPAPGERQRPGQGGPRVPVPVPPPGLPPRGQMVGSQD